MHWVSDRFFDDKCAIFQQLVYHGENKLNLMMSRCRFVLDKHAYFDLYSASSLKQHFVGRYVIPLGHIILIPSQPIFALTN
jgi:hypothetical protein